MVFKRSSKTSDGSSQKRTPGVKPSLFNRTSLVSCGVESLDSAVGGGLSLGTITGIFEDYPSSWHSMILRHFLVQGVASGHKVKIFTTNVSLLKQLPILSEVPISFEEPKDLNDELRIAWRYKTSLQSQQPSAYGNSDSTFCHRFDMSRFAGDDVSSVINATCVDSALSRNLIVESVGECLKEILSQAESESSSVARIVLESLGSANWMALDGLSDSDRTWYELTEMLHIIKGLVRGCRASVLVTFPGWVLDSGHGPRLLRLMDTAVALRGGAELGDVWREHYSGYEGIVQVLKLARLNSLLAPPLGLSSTHLLRASRRRLMLEPMHTAPDVETAGARLGPGGQADKASKVDF